MNDILWFCALVAGILAFVGTAALAGFLAAPWLPVRQKELARLFELLPLTQGSLFYDLGSGDGRIMIEAVRQYSVQARGYEISVLPFAIGWLRLRFFSKRHLVQLRYANLFTVPLHEADTVFCFLTPPAMQKLRAKFLGELRPGARVISYAFPVPGWEPTQEIRPFPKSIRAFVYDIDAVRGRMV